MFLEEEQISSLFKHLGYPHKLICEIGLTTGLRVSDIVALKKDILNKKEPTIREKKTGKSKRIYINKKLKAELLEYCKNNKTYIFETNSKCGHITRQAVHKALKKACFKADIKRNVATHSMRKTYAKRMLKKNKGLKYVKSKLNHSTIADTLLYISNEKR